MIPAMLSPSTIVTIAACLSPQSAPDPSWPTAEVDCDSVTIDPASRIIKSIQPITTPGCKVHLIYAYPPGQPTRQYLVDAICYPSPGSACECCELDKQQSPTNPNFEQWVCGCSVEW